MSVPIEEKTIHTCRGDPICNGHGSCSEYSGICICDDGFAGDSCEHDHKHDDGTLAEPMAPPVLAAAADTGLTPIVDFDYKNLTVTLSIGGDISKILLSIFGN